MEGLLPDMAGCRFWCCSTAWILGQLAKQSKSWCWPADGWSWDPGCPRDGASSLADKARQRPLPPPGFSAAVPWEFQIWCQPTGGWCWILDAKGHKVSRTDTGLVVCRARA